MMDTLQELRRELVKGQKLSMQGSYQRRAPADSAVPHLLAARTGLRRFTREESSNPDGWRLLSQAEECLLNYRGAITALETSMSLSGKRDKRDPKRLAMLRDAASGWDELPLTPLELEQLDAYLESVLTVQACDHTQRHTREWLLEAGKHKPKRILDALRNRGGYCDCEVLSNAV